MEQMNRYSVITEKNPREIVLLRGFGCQWRRCAFCDYHLDYSKNASENYALNQIELAKVTGKYHKLEVINSGSFTDLDEDTMQLIKKVCVDKEIQEIHFECHWMHKDSIPALRASFAEIGVDVKIKIGVETFDADYRENRLRKGITETEPEKIAEGFNEVCLLFGLDDQTEESMRNDIITGLSYFERVCVNVMVENSTKIHPNKQVIETFLSQIYPEFKEDSRVDILIENTDFGVGEKL